MQRQRFVGWGMIMLGLAGVVLFPMNSAMRARPLRELLIDSAIYMAIFLLGASLVLHPRRPRLANRLLVLSGIFVSVGLLRFF
ncbi:MAG TPA: hypothetical protein VGD69_19820 [Herpetosiphonaceae bacterium]